MTRLKDIAEKINVYLKRFEADPRVNRYKDPTRTLTPYWHSYAWANGRYVGIQYVSFQGSHFLSRADAEKYLAWLEQGGIGTHFRAGVA